MGNAKTRERERETAGNAKTERERETMESAKTGGRERERLWEVLRLERERDCGKC